MTKEKFTIGKKKLDKDAVLKKKIQLKITKKNKNKEKINKKVNKSINKSKNKNTRGRIAWRAGGWGEKERDFFRGEPM